MITPNPMIFTEIEPNESFDLRRFRSTPSGRWEAGVCKMLWAKYRVALSPANSQVYLLSYWGGDLDTAALLCGFIIGVCSHLPETLTEEELRKIFPVQNDKDLGPLFWAELFRAGDRARANYGSDIRNVYAPPSD